MPKRSLYASAHFAISGVALASGADGVSAQTPASSFGSKSAVAVGSTSEELVMIGRSRPAAFACFTINAMGAATECTTIESKSAERRVGKEGGRTCRSRWSTYHKKKKHKS